MKKWLLRLLIAFCVIIGAILLALNVVSGTSETQKRGLEQAFSQIFGGTARFGKLDSFNLFPKFTLQISNLEISGLPRPDGKDGEVRADLIGIGFGSEDLLFKTRQIERFDIKGLSIGEGVYFPLRLDVVQAGIFPLKEAGQAQFVFSGTYGGKELKGEIAMAATSGLSPKFGLLEENKFTMNIGAIQASGIYVPYQAVGGQVKELGFVAAGKNGQQTCHLPTERILSSSEYFKGAMASFVAVKSPADFTELCEKLSKIPVTAPSPASSAAPRAEESK